MIANPAGFQVNDKRGRESEATRDPREQQVIKDAKKPKIIPMRRCPNCRQNQHEAAYLFSPSIQFYVCLECGAAFMDVKFAREVYKVSIEGKVGVDVNANKKG